MSESSLFRKLMGATLRLSLLVSSFGLITFSVLAGLDVVPGLHDIFIAGVVVFFFLTTARHIWLIYHAFKAKREHEENDSLELKEHPSITIIMPAYNEEAVIKPALLSLTQLNYPNYNILVINDGSQDKTSEKVQEVIDLETGVEISLIEQANGGKASALNNGIIHATGDLFFCVDSDSRLHKDALLAGARHFVDDEIAAVAGAVEIVKQDNLLLKFQQLEYQFCINFNRQAFSRQKIITIVPGPSGLFRRKAMLEVGGYEVGKEVFAEDAELTIRLLAKDWKIVGEERMVAYTEAPRSIFPLLRQRYRWKRGLFQAFAKNVLELINSDQKQFLFIFFNLLFDSFLFDLLNFSIVVCFLTHFFKFGTIGVMYYWFAVLLFLDVFVAVAFSRKGQRRVGVGLMLLQKISYYLLLQAWGVLALIDEFFTTEMSWDKLERTGELSVE